MIFHLAKTTAQEVADILEHQIITVFPGIRKFISDQGSNLLISKPVKKVCAQYGIKAILTCPFAPWSHGLIERNNLTITILLKTLHQQLDKLPWVQLCAFTQKALNNMPFSALQNRTPNYVMFGLDDDAHQEKIEAHQLGETDWEKHREICEAISRTMAEQRHKAVLKKGGRPYVLNQGDWVYLKNFARIPKMKLQSNYVKTPFKVIQVRNSQITVESFTGKVQIVHKHNTKPYEPRTTKLFATLPMTIRQKLGDDFTHAKMDEALRKHDLPVFYEQQNKAALPSVEKPNTRSVTKAEEEADKLNKIPTQQQADDLLAKAGIVWSNSATINPALEEDDDAKQIQFSYPLDDAGLGGHFQ